MLPESFPEVSLQLKGWSERFAPERRLMRRGAAFTILIARFSRKLYPGVRSGSSAFQSGAGGRWCSDAGSSLTVTVAPLSPSAALEGQRYNLPHAPLGRNVFLNHCIRK